MAALIGNPQDVLTTPYGYSGQMSPEAAVQEQALNRRRLIANMLMQQGMQPKQGRQAGRFFVAPNPLEHVAGLAQFGAGLYSNYNTDQQQKDIIQQDRQSVVDAIKNWKDRQGQLTQASQAPVGVSGNNSRLPSVDPGNNSGVPSRPEGPYNGEIGAVPMPEVGVTNSYPTEPMRGPATAQPAPNMKAPTDPRAFLNEPPVDYRPMNERLQSSGADPGGLSKEVTPADMSQFAPQPAPPQATPAQPLPQPAPAPTPQAAPRKPTMDDLAELLTHQHPVVRQYGAMLAQQMQKEQEHAAQREFLKTEKETQREWQGGQNELTRQNQRELVGSKLDQALMMGLISKEQRDQMMQMQAKQNELAADIKKAEIGSRGQIAKQHDETLKSIAQMNMEGRKEIAGMKDASKQEGKEQSRESAMATIAQLRDSYDQLDRMGGITNTEKSGMDNLKASASSSPLGQFFGRTFGTEAQSHRNTIKQLRVPLVTQVMRATGASAKSLDSNMELKAWLDAASSPDNIDIQANRRALDNLENVITSGKLPGEPGFTYAHKPAAPAAPAAPSGGGGWSIRPIQ